MTTKPSYLFIIGAPKAGTTSIANRLNRSDQITMSSTKEPLFFTDYRKEDWTGPVCDGLKEQHQSDFAAYDRSFDYKPTTPWRLDASTDYLSCDASPQLIADFAKEHTVKVVAILRDPVARIVSEFQHTLRDGMQSGSLEQSLAAEAERTAKSMHPLFRHIKRSTYAAQISKYRALFGDDFLVLDFHTLHQDGAGVDKITDFIGLPSMDIAEPAAHLNKSHVPRSTVLSSMLKSERLKSALRVVVPKALRPMIWNVASKANQTSYTATQGELTMVRDLLADEIAACEAHPDISTEHWRLARGE